MTNAYVKFHILFRKFRRTTKSQHVKRTFSGKRESDVESQFITGRALCRQARQILQTNRQTNTH